MEEQCAVIGYWMTENGAFQCPISSARFGGSDVFLQDSYSHRALWHSFSTADVPL